MERYVMALDAGTTSSRCMIFNRRGEVCAMEQAEFHQYFPQPGWVEHDAEEVFSTQLTTARSAMERLGLRAEQIAAIGIANQRETTVVWEKATGRPVGRAIVWQCRRTALLCDELSARSLADPIRAKTGLTIDAYFSATKLRWLLDHTEDGQARAERGELLFGNIDAWLIWKLTGGRVHATDYSNASRTMLFNIHSLRWDEDILGELNIPAAMLPEVLPSSGVFGETDPAWFGAPIPIAGAAGDQQAALFGQTCFEPGQAKNTYGTGCFLLMNTGAVPVDSRHGLVSTIAWGMDGRVEYALEGSVFVAGAAIQWLRDELGLIKTAAETEEMALRVPDTAGCYVVPAFTGLGAPYWDAYARGAIFGLTRGVGRDHLARAVLESLAYQTCDVLHAMQEDSGITLSALRVDGGACANNFLMQFQADMIGAPVLRPACIETTAMGAAFLAGLAVGYWSGREDVRRSWTLSRTFVPDCTDELRRERLGGWHRAVGRACGWARPYEVV